MVRETEFMLQEIHLLLEPRRQQFKTKSLMKGYQPQTITIFLSSQLLPNLLTISSILCFYFNLQ